jgi:hypothetical protein
VERQHGSFRQELIELSQSWTILGLPGACPYQPTAQQLAEHTKQYEEFESIQQMRMLVVRALKTDSNGWISFGRLRNSEEGEETSL